MHLTNIRAKISSSVDVSYVLLSSLVFLQVTAQFTTERRTTDTRRHTTPLSSPTTPSSTKTPSRSKATWVKISSRYKCLMSLGCVLCISTLWNRLSQRLSVAQSLTSQRANSVQINPRSSCTQTFPFASKSAHFFSCNAHNIALKYR